MHPTTGKTMALTRWTFVSKLMSLPFSMLSRLVIAFLLRRKCLLISWLQSLLAVTIWSPKKIKSSHCFHFFPIYLPWSVGTESMILVFWKLNFILVSWRLSLSQLSYSPLSLSSRGSWALLHFLPWGWCHLSIWGYWYFFPAILIPACASSSPGFLMMYSAYKLNKQGDNILPWHTPLLIWNQSLFHV